MRNTVSSSSSTPKWTYDVFLSFRGEDVRKNFVSFLYRDLQQKGIYTFKDDEKLERGRSISPALCQAIEESRIAVIIFSKNYASSSWCLDELVKIMECRRVLGQTVLPVFYYVDPSVVRKQKGSFSEAFAKHEDEVEDNKRIQRWRAALTEAASLSGCDVPNTANGDESECVQKIVGDVMDKLGNAIVFNDGNHVGIDSRVQTVDALLKLGLDDVRFVGIWGMSGIGKTTIARTVFDRIVTHFEGFSFLHEVGEYSKKYGLEKLQENILTKILCQKDWRIDNVFEGSNMIKRRLRSKKVLVVLDDIDRADQLAALAGKHDWFGAGSRIIITTKDKHLLVEHEVHWIHEVELLNEHEAIQLLSWKAFKKNYPPRDFETLSIQIVQYAGGLPLALEVLGSFLYGRDTAEWRSEVERLKRIPEDDIMKKLIVSFDGLKDVEKQIFLDIACFFKGKKVGRVERVLDSFDFYPVIGIKVLIEKSLVTVPEGRIWMHPLIQEMGRHIVRQEAPQEPGKHSRLWDEEVICHVLARDRVTENIQALWLDLHTPKNVVFKNEAFEKMKKLRLLKIHNVCVSHGPNYIPSEIRWLNWHGYPSKSLPASFQAEKLVGLKLKSSSIVELWKGVMLLDKLKFINLSHSRKLIRTPDFTGITNLERLILEDCSSLTEIHSSAGNLKKLQLINLRKCTSLASLPSSIGRLKCLKALILSGCSKFNKLPEEIGHLESLEELYCDETAVSQPPSSIMLLKNLKTLSLKGCKGTASRIGSRLPFSWMLRRKCQDSMRLVLPCFSGLTSLARLDLSDCNLLDGGFSCELGSLSSLRVLCLRGNNFSSISAAGIKNLSRLRIIELVGCKRLEILPELPPSIEHVYADNCTSLQSEATIVTKYRKLRWVSFSYCFQLFQDPQTSIPIDEKWKQMVKELSARDNQLRWFSMCLPGRNIPAWFTYQNTGPSISIPLAWNWDRNEFMGLAICIVVDRFRRSLRHYHFMLIKVSRHDAISSVVRPMCIIGSEEGEKNVDLGHTCFGFLPHRCIEWIEENRCRPNDWSSIMTLRDPDDYENVYKAWGARLVYKEDAE